MSGDTADLVGIDVDPLHRTGARVAGLAHPAGSAATRAHGDLQAAHGEVGDPDFARAMAGFVAEHIHPDAHHLARNVAAAGHGVCEVAVTARAGDNEGGRDLHRLALDAQGMVERINPGRS